MLPPRSILFVCKANMCRSPSAAIVLRSMLIEHGAGAAFDIDSAGTHHFERTASPHEAAILAAKRRGYIVTPSIARRISPADFERFDMILAMDKENVFHLCRIAPTRFKPRIELLLEYGDRYYSREIPDPIGGDEASFDACLDMIEDGCRGLVKFLVRAA